MKSSALLQAGALALIALAPSASAAIISVANPSFETLPVGGLPFVGCGAGCGYSDDAIPGWIRSASNGGQFQPGSPATTTYFDTLSDGPTSAWTNGPTISQILAPTVQLGVLYTLLVDIGQNKTAAGLGSAFITIGGVPVAGATGVLVPGGFATFTATYTGLAGDVGQSIGILLTTSGFQGNFDNVRFSDDIPGPAPEPGTIGLLGLGLGALVALRRRSAASRL